MAWSFVSKDKLSSLLAKEHLLTFTFHKTLSCSFFNHERWNWISSCYPCGITSVSSCAEMELSIHFIWANRFTICFIITVPAFLPLIISDKQMLSRRLLWDTVSRAAQGLQRISDRCSWCNSALPSSTLGGVSAAWWLCAVCPEPTVLLNWSAALASQQGVTCMLHRAPSLVRPVSVQIKEN